MAIFPSLTPNQREYTLGTFPLTEQPLRSAGFIRFRHGTSYQGQQLTLTYNALLDSEAQQIRDHYNNQDGGFRHFQLPATVWSGYEFSGAVFPYNTGWVYDQPPQETHISVGYVQVAISLRADGLILNGNSLGEVAFSIVGGSANLGGVTPEETYSVTVSFSAGTATGA